MVLILSNLVQVLCSEPFKQIDSDSIVNWNILVSIFDIKNIRLLSKEDPIYITDDFISGQGSIVLFVLHLSTFLFPILFISKLDNDTNTAL